MANRDVVVLVDELGNECGTSEKLVAHDAPGQRHRAFSVVLFRSDGKMLLQQRAADKYHFPMMWANACCSHPGPGESIVDSATARVQEELGVDCSVKEVGSFVYRATCPQTGRVEFEFDHVLVGTTDEIPAPDPSEVAALQWVDARELDKLMEAHLTVPWLADALRLAGAFKESPSSETTG